MWIEKNKSLAKSICFMVEFNCLLPTSNVRNVRSFCVYVVLWCKGFTKLTTIILLCLDNKEFTVK